jgi:hypothetical protein
MPSSSSVINYSVRHNKSIERALVFEALRRLQAVLPWDACVYVGLGSAWFVDFDLAHRELGVETMISIEGDETTYQRACFNAPFRTVEVLRGFSHDETPKLLARPSLRGRPWIVWLDYDEKLDGTKLDELNNLIREAPPNSVILTTFNAHAGSYASSNEERLKEFKELFGAAFPSEAHPAGRGLNKFSTVQRVLAEALLDTLDSTARSVARPGGLHRGFNLRYQDGAPMVTVGVVLSSPDRRQAVAEVVSDPNWRALGVDSIESPPLTPKEVAALRTLLPSTTAPNRDDVKRLGFDLPESQIASFVRYYLDYPSWVQTVR